MATVLMSVPEEHLTDVIAVIRAGLDVLPVNSEVFENLNEWCDSQEEYLADLEEDDSPIVLDKKATARLDDIMSKHSGELPEPPLPWIMKIDDD